MHDFWVEKELGKGGVGVGCIVECGTLLTGDVCDSSGCVIGDY